jgi:hypothetical protein
MLIYDNYYLQQMMLALRLAAVSKQVSVGG